SLDAAESQRPEHHLDGDPFGDVADESGHHGNRGVEGPVRGEVGENCLHYDLLADVGERISPETFQRCRPTVRRKGHARVWDRRPGLIMVAEWLKRRHPPHKRQLRSSPPSFVVTTRYRWRNTSKSSPASWPVRHDIATRPRHRSPS